MKTLIVFLNICVLEILKNVFRTIFLQEGVKRSDIYLLLPQIIQRFFFSLNQMSEFSHRKCLWKLNESLLSNKEYVEKIKEHTLLTIEMLNIDELRDE